MRWRERQQDHRDEAAEPSQRPVRRQHGDGLGRIAELQRSAGNQVVVAATAAAAPGGLVVGHAHDAAERAADAAADRALTRLTPVAADAEVHRSASGGTAEVGIEGGPVQAETAAAIESARGSGRTLDGPLRREMETAFGGADFGGVRIHDDARSAQLNTRLAARAFTTGRDVFFGKGEYRPDTAAGQRVLAHELAHTLQQDGGDTVGRQAIHRLAFDNTSWSSATKAKVSTGGGLGVLIIDDGTAPLVVKAGESMAVEAAVAAKLLTQATGGGGTGWTAAAPEARPVDAAEAQTIHSAVQPLLGNSRREKNVLDDLATGKGVMVFGFAKGQELQEHLSAPQTKKGLFGASVRKDSAAYALMNDAGLLRSLGRASASDVILGNADRLVGSINFENVMLDLQAKHISLIDNVQMKNETFLRSAVEYDMTGQDSFKAWAQAARTKKLAGGDFKGLSSEEMLREASGIGATLERAVSDTDRKAVMSMFASKKQKLVQWFADGLAEGTKNCLAALKTSSSLVSSLPPEQRQEVATCVIARRNFVQGMSVDAAWNAAEQEAAAMFAAAPSTPATASAPAQATAPSQWKSATPTGKWKSATPTGKWKSATPSALKG